MCQALEISWPKTKIRLGNNWHRNEKKVMLSKSYAMLLLSSDGFTFASRGISLTPAFFLTTKSLFGR